MYLVIQAPELPCIVAALRGFLTHLCAAHCAAQRQYDGAGMETEVTGRQP